MRSRGSPSYGDGTFRLYGRRTYLGFGSFYHDSFRTHAPAYAWQSVTLVVPWAAVVAVLAASPAWRGTRTVLSWYRRYRDWRQHRRSHLACLCAACGYNLTGNVSGVCPECGTGCAPKAAHAPTTAVQQA